MPGLQLLPLCLLVALMLAPHGVGVGRLACAQTLTVADGPCTVAGKCFQSPNYPSNYGNSETCTFRWTGAAAAALLTAEAFDTQSGYDKLTLGDAQYSGTAGPTDVVVIKGQTITWSAN